MSTFSGFLYEIDDVSVDRFTDVNFDRSSAFFLSHCHTDHMVGLSEINSSNQLPGLLYLSEISKVIIQRQYPEIKNLVALKTGEPTPVEFGISQSYEDDEYVPDKTTVTAIPAGHCPGSVMFLFEQNDKKILYTGDFRLHRNDIEAIIALKKIHEEMNLDGLHFDSTFFSLDYKYFPRQRESVKTIIKLTEDWLDAHPKNVVLLRPPANYGYEFLMVELSQHFRNKIHVTKSTYKDYLYIPEFDSYISSNPHHCGRIHLCAPEDDSKWQSKTSTCLPNLEEKHICIIRPTAMKWKNLNEDDKHYEAYDGVANTFSVCYSNHSSYDEIKFLIEYLRPKDVKFNVVPKDISQKNHMDIILHDITKEYLPKPPRRKVNYLKYTAFLASQEYLSMSWETTSEDRVSNLNIKRRRTSNN